MADMQEQDQVRKAVRDRYAGIAEKGIPEGGSCSGETPTQTSNCCGTAAPLAAADQDEISRQLGYSLEELAEAPEGANLGLGCGNPQAIAALKAGEVVLDLGSGAGFDCFLAARAVGPTGRAVGVDMTPEMVTRARELARTSGNTNVEFRLGEIEHLPIADNAVDVIISNCVINLSPDKPAVFQEAFRVLKPGGRLAVSDVVRVAPFPAEWLKDMDLVCSCVTGASAVTELETMLTEAGFTGIDISPKDESKEFIRDWKPWTKLEEYVLSASIRAVKP
jgi:arsenite methyltransferase